MIKVIPGITLFVGIGIGFATAASITACVNRTPFESSGYDAKTLLPWKTQQENARQAVVVTGSDTNNASVVADFVLAERDIELGLPGRLGMMLASEGAGVKIREIRPASPADKAGFFPGHRIHTIAGEAVRNMQDVRLALLDRMPGEKVWVEFEPGVKPRNGETQGRTLPLL